jgi:hypothetical protein
MTKTPPGSTTTVLSHGLGVDIRVTSKRTHLLDRLAPTR